MKTFTVLGTTDDHLVCELCGRDDLKSTVALQPADGSAVVYFGSDCAARATGWTTDEIRTATKSADAAAREARIAAQAAAADAAFSSWETFLAETTGLSDVTAAIAALGGFAAARRLYREAGAE